MKTIKAAGGIVVRKSPKGVSVLLIYDMNSTWSFPKGHVEDNEKFLDTAVREIKEETHVDKLIYKHTFPAISYTFKNHGIIKKVVSYFLFETTYRSKLIPQKSEGIKQVKFMPLGQAYNSIGYKNTNLEFLKYIKKKYLS
jgi:ADP-ribose pyrophosphatase YjhB (NUDIX family)